MSQFIFKMPDLGEGTVEAEIVAWHTKPGDVVHEDQVIVEVMTDKAAVEVPAPVSGRVVSISGAPGDKIAVGSPLIVFENERTEHRRCSPRAPAAARGTATARSTATARGKAAARGEGARRVPAAAEPAPPVPPATPRGGSSHGLAGQPPPGA